MKCDCRTFEEKAALSVTEPLKPRDQALLDDHLATCADCRELQQQLQADHSALEQLAESHAATMDRINRRTVEGLKSGAKPDRHETWHRRIGRGWQIAAAAGLILVCGVLLNRPAAPDASGVLWAQVPEHLESVQTLMYNIRTRITGFSGLPLIPENGIEMAVTVHVSSLPGFWQYPQDASQHPPGARVFDDGSGYVLSNDDAMATHGVLEQIGPLQLGGAEDVRALVQRFVALEHRDLGVEHINGIEAAVMEVTDSALLDEQFDSLRARLWVGAADELPVKLELNAYNSRGKLTVQIVLDEFFYGWEQELNG